VERRAAGGFHLDASRVRNRAIVVEIGQAVGTGAERD
jgi:hypothetical protein